MNVRIDARAEVITTETVRFSIECDLSYASAKSLRNLLGESGTPSWMTDDLRGLRDVLNVVLEKHAPKA